MAPQGEPILPPEQPYLNRPDQLWSTPRGPGRFGEVPDQRWPYYRNRVHPKTDISYSPDGSDDLIGTIMNIAGTLAGQR